MFNKAHLILPSKMNKAVNNEKTRIMVSSVLNMISTDASEFNYSMTENNITFEEELFANKFLNTNIYKYSSAMMYSNNRFIYFNNINYFDNDNEKVLFKKMIYSTKSSLNDNNMNTFTTYFISGGIKNNDDSLLELIIDIISNKLNRYIENEFNVTFDRDENYKETLNFAYSDETSISCDKMIFCLYDTIFSTVDSIIDLTYNDYDRIAKIMNLSDEEKNMIEIIYKNSITLPRSNQADNEAFKEYFYYI